VVIRSMANPAIDMNNPEDPYKFYGYITREQYGDRPLAYGPYFNAPQTNYKVKGTRYFKGEDKYEKGYNLRNDHFLIVGLTLPFTLLFTLPFTDFSSFCGSLVRVGNSGWTLSFTIDSGISQKKIAPSLPTVMIFL